MPRFPLNQKTNIKTANEGEFVYKNTNLPFNGEYFIENNKIYSSKNKSELIPNSNLFFSNDIIQSSSNNNNPLNINSINTIRYFIYKITDNNPILKEINFQEIKNYNSLYKVLTLDFSSLFYNLEVLKIEKQFPGFREMFKI